MTDLAETADLVQPEPTFRVVKSSKPDIIREEVEYETYVDTEEEKTVRGSTDGFMNLLSTQIARDERFKHFYYVQAFGWKTLQQGEVVTKGLVSFLGIRHNT